MNIYIGQWLEIIKNCSFDNTYKMAWAKALVELALESEVIEYKITIRFEQIAEKCLKYYWNQTIFFDLIQGSNHKKIPEIMTETKHLINLYQVATGSYQPIRYEKAVAHIDRLMLTSEYVMSIRNISNTLKQDVCWRFMKIGKSSLQVYDLDRKAGEVYFTSEHLQVLKDYSELMFQVINYRWTQMLETFNSSPRIAMKVRSTHEPDGVKRKSLSKFHKYLDMEWDDGRRICFHCSESIDDDVSVDHVIPWSFMYSDDIWNLVFCHKSENFSKSNIIVSEDDILRLEERNRFLLDRFNELGVRGKVYDELKLAIEHNYVRKFWIAAKG